MDKAYGMYEVLLIQLLLGMYFEMVAFQAAIGIHICSQALITPYAGNLTAEEEIFNRYNKTTFPLIKFYSKGFSGEVPIWEFLWNI